MVTPVVQHLLKETTFWVSFKICCTTVLALAYSGGGREGGGQGRRDKDLLIKETLNSGHLSNEDSTTVPAT